MMFISGWPALAVLGHTKSDIPSKNIQRLNTTELSQTGFISRKHLLQLSALSCLQPLEWSLECIELLDSAE